MNVRQIRAALKNWPWLYEAGALGALIYSLTLKDHTRGPLGFLAEMDEKEALAIDVGANRGQTIARIARLKPKWRIVAFEPNPACTAHLKVVKRMLGRRLTVHPVGLSDREGEADYFEPKLKKIGVAAEGTFEPANLDDSVAERVGGAYEVMRTRLPLRTLDSYALDPAFVKIDVQGLEDKVLGGMAATLERSKPVLFIERNRLNQAAVESRLFALGYGNLSTAYDVGEGDLLFVHPRSDHRLR